MNRPDRHVEPPKPMAQIVATTSLAAALDRLFRLDLDGETAVETLPG